MSMHVVKHVAVTIAGVLNFLMIIMNDYNRTMTIIPLLYNACIIIIMVIILLP